MRWAAPEVLEDGVFSLKSDAWSFGVLVWEIWALGDKPYNNMKLNKDVRRAILAGNRLPWPEGCPGEIYNMMMNCWEYVRLPSRDQVFLFKFSLIFFINFFYD